MAPLRTNSEAPDESDTLRHQAGLVSVVPTISIAHAVAGADELAWSHLRTADPVENGQNVRA